MPNIKEKPPSGKPKGKPSPILQPKQAARLMKEKYLQQLDQRPEQPDAGNGDAAQEVENAGRWAVDELTTRAPGFKSRQERPVKERPPDATERTAASPDAAPPADGPAQERPANAPKERQTVERGATPARECGGADRRLKPKERPATRMLKERQTQSNAAPEAGRATSPAHNSASAPVRSAQPQQAQRQLTLNNWRRGPAAFHEPTGSTGLRSVQSASPVGAAHFSRDVPASGKTARSATGSAPKGTNAIRERTQAAKSAIKTRSNARAAAKTGRVTPKPRPSAPLPAAGTAVQKARKQMQQQVSRVMNTQAAKAVKTAAVTAKRVTAAVVKATAALVSALMGIMGGGILLVALVIVIVIAAVANSPFGLFFAEEKNAPDTVSVAEAVSTVNMDYNAKLETLQAGSYDSVVVEGRAADWPDVLAVFAVKLAGADADGLDVATLDADRVEKLKAVFWDMTDITSYVEEIPHEDWTEYILHIVITPKTADDMRTAYSFTDYQNSALDELLADRAALSALAGSLTITNADVSAVLEALPADLSPERREAVRTALTVEFQDS